MNKTDQHITLKDNRKLGFAEYGNTKGYPIIYFHGSQSSRLEMHYDMSFAIRNDLRIITIDRPGHGLSDFNPDGSILSFAKDVNQLTQYFEISSYSVVGMSAGAPFALAFTYLFSKNIHKTSIISGFAPYTRESKMYLLNEVKTMLNLAKTFPFLLKVLLKIQDKQIRKSPKKALQGFLKIMSDPDKEVLKNKSVVKVIEDMFKESFRNGSKGITYEISQLLVNDWNFQLNEIERPITFWQGKKDNNIPYKWAELMSNQIPNAKLNIYPNEGHLIIFNHAEEIFSELKRNIPNKV